MTKVGLKETLSLLAAGYKKKDIEALAAIDEENEAQAPAPEAPAPVTAAPAQDDATNKELEEKKKELEEALAKLKESETKLKKIQQDNVHADSTPATEEDKKKQAESLNNLVRSFM